MAITPEALRLQRELRAQLDGVLDEQLRDLTKAWVRAWDEVSIDLRDALIALLADDAITRAKLLRAERLKRALSAIAKQLGDLADEAQLRILTDLEGIVDHAGAAQSAILDSQLPPDSGLLDLLAWARVDKAQVEAIVRRSTEKITSDLHPLSDDAMEVVRRELVRGVAAGSNPKTVAKAMVRRAERGFNGGLTRALTISRTEIVDAHRAAAAVGQAQHADVLAGWMWLAHLSARTCRSCISMHGRIFDLEEPGPHDHQQGRCSRMPTTKPWSDLGFDVDEPPSAVPDAETFFDSLTPAEQIAMLGRRGHEAWLAGDFPREAWAEKRHNEGWRDAFVPAKPPAEGEAAGGAGNAGSTPPAPPGGADPTDPGSGDDLPPMGPTLGTWEQQVYVKDGVEYQLPPGRLGFPAWFEEIADANIWHTYVPDDEDRTTALLQYVKSSEEAVKIFAKNRYLGLARTSSNEDLVDKYFEYLQLHPASGVRAAGFTRQDLITDLEGAAARLLRREVIDVGTVYRGIRLPGFDPLTQDIAEAASLIRTSSWWFESASPDLETAAGYAVGGRTGIPAVIMIEDAMGVELQSMGRMSAFPEVLLTGRIEIVGTPRLEHGIILIRARWKA